MKEIAIFGLGCFWSPDFHFSHLKGIEKVIVGYSGGKKKNPTYHDLGDHTETVKIEYDPKLISFQKLLDHFFNQHNPEIEQKNQYRSVIFYQNENQKKIAEKAIQDYQKKTKLEIATKLEKALKFYPAEEYHQKYYEKNNVRGSCHV